jgi:hypothetical protein
MLSKDLAWFDVQIAEASKRAAKAPWHSYPPRGT